MPTKMQVPPRDECVLRYMLERRAREEPGRVFMRLGDGSSYTYGEFHDAVVRTAAGLAALGVKQGDTVTVWMPNSPDVVRVWFAMNYLGAVYVPINVAYRGNLLAHVIANAGSELLIAHADLLPRLADIDRSRLRQAVAFGGAPCSIDGMTMHGPEALLREARALPALQGPIEPWDVQSIIYTSGTTGRSKGVISSYAHMYEMSGTDSWYMVDRDDCFLLYGPLCHVSGTLPVMAALQRGGAVALAGEFSTDSFWPSIHATQATFVVLLGVMSSFIAKLPPSPRDRDHPLKKVMMIPLPDDWRAFADRFGVKVWTLYNMSELNVPIVSEPDPPVAGSCGRVRPNVDVRIVDDHDIEVEPGQVGELLVRTDRPWCLNSGYFKDPAATAAAWRNGWFHTGDAFRCDAEGNYFFVDRKKDAIRRRGENISSFEVEVELLAHPAVRECAVVAVPNEQSEDDVLAVVAPVPGASIEPVQLLEFLQPRLAHFMLPRYVRVLEALPRTPTQKVEKHVLRAEGVTPDTWDRERAGIRIGREKLAL